MEYLCVETRAAFRGVFTDVGMGHISGGLGLAGASIGAEPGRPYDERGATGGTPPPIFWAVSLLSARSRGSHREGGGAVLARGRSGSARLVCARGSGGRKSCVLWRGGPHVGCPADGDPPPQPFRVERDPPQRDAR